MKFKILYKNDKRIFSILLLFFFKGIFGQQITVNNKNSFPIQIEYNNSKVKINGNDKKIIIDKNIKYLNIKYFNGTNTIFKHIPILINDSESLSLSVINNYEKSIQFEGDKDKLHDLIVNQQHYLLYKNIVRYQDLYYKSNKPTELINASHIVLGDYLNKIKVLSVSASDKDKEVSERAEMYAINEWVASLFLMLTESKTLELNTKELILYYYTQYIKKGFKNCDYRAQYDIMIDLARYVNQLKISLLKYPVIEDTEDNSINQYLPESCQKFYFRNKLNYYDKINSQKKEYYKKILKEKFND